MGMHCATTFVTNRQRCPPTEIIQSGRATPARTLDSPVLFPTFLITGREVQDRWTAGFRDVTLGSLPIFQLCSLFSLSSYSVLSFCLVLPYIPSAFFYLFTIPRHLLRGEFASRRRSTTRKVSATEVPYIRRSYETLNRQAD